MNSYFSDICMSTGLVICIGIMIKMSRNQEKKCKRGFMIELDYGIILFVVAAIICSINWIIIGNAFLTKGTIAHLTELGLFGNMMFALSGWYSLGMLGFRAFEYVDNINDANQGQTTMVQSSALSPSFIITFAISAYLTFQILIHACH